MSRYVYSLLFGILCAYGPYLVFKPYRMWLLPFLPCWPIALLFRPILGDSIYALLTVSGVLTVLFLAAFTAFCGRSNKTLAVSFVIALLLSILGAWVMLPIIHYHAIPGSSPLWGGVKG